MCMKVGLLMGLRRRLVENRNFAHPVILMNEQSYLEIEGIRKSTLERAERGVGKTIPYDGRYAGMLMLL